MSKVLITSKGMFMRRVAALAESRTLDFGRWTLDCYHARGMEGQLNEHSLAELISEIMAKRLSGALRVGRERVKAVVYFNAGELIYATSNLRNLRLSEYLKRRGLESQMAAAGADPTSDFAIADALMSRGFLTAPVLDELRGEQVADVLRVSLLWTSGQWSFDSQARLTVPIQVRIHIKQLLVDAARRMDLQFALSRFRNPNELISPVMGAVDEVSLSSAETLVRSRVESPIAVEKIVALSGLREPEAHRTIFGLVLAGVLERELWPHAFRATAPDVKSAQAPKSAAPVNVPPKAKTEPVRDPQQELMEFLERLAQATTHYEVLNVSSSADAGEVKLAYYALARRFHPDRFHDLARTPLHSRLESAFARITQAHETLSNSNLRAAYDGKIDALRTAGTVPSPAAHQHEKSTPLMDNASGNGEDEQQSLEKRFNEGLAALQLGQVNLAITSLSVAARLAPKQARYRAHYGRALAARQQTQRLAEAELQAAITLDPDNASYRVLLADLYRNLGFTRRAIAELKRALSLDSRNAEARQMLQILEAKK